jgi:peptidyl-prolyl cis-trans isomerase C
MKILSVSFLFTALLCGQVAPPVSVSPGVPVVKAPGEASPAPGPSTPPKPIAPDTVVAEVNGKKYTAAELDKMISMLPAQYQPVARMQPNLLGQLFLMQRLAGDAEKAGLDQKQPLKDQIEMQRMQLLSTAELTDMNNTMKVTDEDQEKYYKDNPDKFKQVKVRVIYIAFAPPPARPVGDAKAAAESAAGADGKKLTEAEAKAKIEDLTKQVQGGADFGKLARELSDDKPSAAKDGDFGVIKQDSSYPAAVKTAVFALKQGELSAPVRQPNGFYLIRAEEVSEASLSDSLGPVSQGARQAKFQEWLKGMQAQYSVKVENSGYFSPPRVPAPVPQPH